MRGSPAVPAPTRRASRIEPQSECRPPRKCMHSNAQSPGEHGTYSAEQSLLAVRSGCEVGAASVVKGAELRAELLVVRSARASPPRAVHCSRGMVCMA